MECPGARGGRTALAAMLLCAMFAAGCANLCVPQFDPTGERIFSGNPVQLDPALGTFPLCGSTLPAVNPAEPVTLLLSPQAMVAPVGSEVILLAGVRRADDYLRTNTRVEWMLDTGSVGHFVDVAKGSITDMFVGDFTRPRKVNDRYAIGSTSRGSFLLTRGNADPGDDVSGVAGQTWVAVTSAQEGTSRITVFTPKVENWNCRTQSAAIHWVDAQWNFPSPAINPAGTTHTFTTTVARHTDQSPCVGWLVRYEILSGPAAGFAPEGAQVVEVPTDDCGLASVDIFQQQPAAGTNTVAIQVIRPGELCGGKRLVVGSGTTLKTWSSSDISVRKSGPTSVTFGSTLTYRIEVSNPGDLPAENVRLTDQIPNGLTYLSSSPQGEQTGRSIGWNLGRLAGGEARTFDVQFQADGQGSVTSCVDVVAGSLTARDCVTTTISMPTIEVTVRPLIEQVRVGDDVTFEIVVTNRGQMTATGLWVKNAFDRGLVHTEAKSLIEKDLDVDLAPGQSRRIGVTFRATKPGKLCNTIEVFMGDRVQASAKACVQVVEPTEALDPQPRPPLQIPPFQTPPPQTLPLPIQPPLPALGRAELSIRVGVSPSLTVGEISLVSIDIANTGQQALSDVTISTEWDVQLEVMRVSEEYENRDGLPTDAPYVWKLPSLPVGETDTFHLEVKGLTETWRSCVRGKVTCAEGVEAEHEACLEIQAPPPPPDLSMEVDALSNPVTQGNDLTYLITVINNGKGPGHDVTVRVTVPEGLEPISQGTDGPTSPPTIIGQTIRFDPVATIPADPTKPLKYRIQLRASAEGVKVLKAELTSQSITEPKRADGRVEILAAGS